MDGGAGSAGKLLAVCPGPVVDKETLDSSEVPRVAGRDAEPVGDRDRGDGNVHVFDEDTARFQSRLLLSEDVARPFCPREPLRQGPPAPILGAQQLYPTRSGTEPRDTKLDLRSNRRRHEQVPGSVLSGMLERDRIRPHQSREGTGIKHQHDRMDRRAGSDAHA